MKIKHNKITQILRYVFALFMIGTGIMTIFFWFLNFDLSAGVSTKTADFMIAIQATGYMVLWLGVFKLITGIFIAIPRTAPAGILAALPYSVNILLYVIFIAFDDYLIMGIVDFAICIYLVYAYSDYYKSLVNANT